MPVLGKPFQPSLMFAGKAKTYPSEATDSFSILEEAPGLTHKQLSMLEIDARNTHSRLQTFVNYRRQTFYNIGSKAVLRSFMFVIS